MHPWWQGCCGSQSRAPQLPRRSDNFFVLHPFSVRSTPAIDAFIGGAYPVAMIAGKQVAAQPSAPANFRSGDERLIKVCPAAANKVSSLLQRQGRPHGVLRVAVVGGGCSGLQYKMDLQDQPANRDILVESGGIKVVVDPKSALYVTGSELDLPSMPCRTAGSRCAIPMPPVPVPAASFSA